MMTNEQYLLGKLAEEAAELAQIAIKAQQFGLDKVFGGESNVAGKSNRERIEDEFNDVLTAVGMVNDLGGTMINVDTQKIDARMIEVKKWQQHAVELGKVESGRAAMMREAHEECK